MNSKKRKTTTWRILAIINTIITTMVLILLGMVLLLTLTANVVGDSVKENLVVTVVLQEDVPTEDALKLQKKLKLQRLDSRKACGLPLLVESKAFKSLIL